MAVFPRVVALLALAILSINFWWSRSAAGPSAGIRAVYRPADSGGGRNVLKEALSNSNKESLKDAQVSTRASDERDAQVSTKASDESASRPDASVGNSMASCQLTRKPYHTLLTGQGTVYNGWQARIMYHHWKKQAAKEGRCTEMTGFTRLCASKGGKPDGLEAYVPSMFVPELTHQQMMQLGGYGVINRPWSVVHFFQNAELESRIQEDFIFIAETDHVPMKPLPNLATARCAARTRQLETGSGTG